MAVSITCDWCGEPIDDTVPQLPGPDGEVQLIPPARGIFSTPTMRFDLHSECESMFADKARQVCKGKRPIKETKP